MANPDNSNPFNNKAKTNFAPKLLIHQGIDIYNDPSKQNMQKKIQQQMMFEQNYSKDQHYYPNNAQDDLIEEALGSMVKEQGYTYQPQQQMVNQNIQPELFRNNQTMFQQPMNQQEMQMNMNNIPRNPNIMNQQYDQFKNMVAQQGNIPREQQNQYFQNNNFVINDQQQNSQPQTKPTQGQESKTIMRTESTNSIGGPGIQNIKSNVKNAYIKKINSILQLSTSQQDLKNAEMKAENIDMDELSDSGDDSKASKEKGPKDEQLRKKLLKNSESAKNSRQRKKMYIELLQKKVQELTHDIDTMSSYIEKSQQCINQILETNPFLNDLVVSRHDQLQKLTKLLKNKQNQEDSISLVNDSYRLRLGATGRVRHSAINLFFKLLEKAFLENNYQLFLFGCKDHIQDEDEEFNNCVRIFQQIVGLPEGDGQIYRVLPILRNLLEHRNKFRRTFIQQKRIRKEWANRCSVLEDSFDKIFNQLTPTQTGLMYTNMNKHRKNPELHTQKQKQPVETQVPQQQQQQEGGPSGFYNQNPPNNYSMYYPILQAASKMNNQSMPQQPNFDQNMNQITSLQDELNSANNKLNFQKQDGLNITNELRKKVKKYLCSVQISF